MTSAGWDQAIGWDRTSGTGPGYAAAWPPDHRHRAVVPGHRPGLLDAAARFTVAQRTLIDGPAPDGLAAHLRRYGERPPARGTAGPQLLDAVTEAALGGRGGAHFPVAAKWRTALASTGHGTLVVANGAEGEPLSAKDTAMLRLRPHLVLDGLISTAEVVDAQAAIVWLHESSTAAHTALAQALDERAAAGYDELPVHIAAGPDGYLTGQSSAVVRALEGGPSLPAFTRVPSAQHGVHGRPTVIHNAETLARVALIARHGPDAQPGPLVTIVGRGMLTVCELPAALTLAAAVLPFTQAPPQALLIGGFGGSWSAWDDVAGLELRHLDGGSAAAGRPARTRRANRRLQLAPARHPSLGAGVLAPIPHDACGIGETASVADYLARSSARQCGPCLFGVRALADALIRIADGSGRRGDAGRLRHRLAEIDGRGACGLPDGAVALVRSALEVFAPDVERHLRRRRCAHGPGAAALPVPGTSSW